MRGPLVDDLKKTGVQIADLRKRGRWDMVGYLRRLRREVRSFRPDVIYSFVGTNVAAAVARNAVPRARLVWGVRASNMDLARYHRVLRINDRVEKLLSNFPDLIISNSVAGRDHAIASGFPRDRLSVVPNGTDIHRFRPDETLRSAQRAAWDIGPGEIVVGMLARLDPMKGYADFLRAAQIVRRSKENVRFLGIGAGLDELHLKALTTELELDGVVRFPGPSIDPNGALNGFDILCAPSVFGEGFSNSIAEAMACGLPCIVTNVGDSAAIVGEDGIVIPPSDPAALATAIVNLLNADRREIGLRARRRIVDRFSVDAMVDLTLQLLTPARQNGNSSAA